MKLYHISQAENLTELVPCVPVSNLPRPKGVYLSDVIHACYWASVMEYWENGFCLYEVEVPAGLLCRYGLDHFTSADYCTGTVTEAIANSPEGWEYGFEIVIDMAVSCKKVGDHNTLRPLLDSLVAKGRAVMECQSIDRHKQRMARYWAKKGE